MIVCAHSLQDASGRRMTINGQPHAVSVVLLAVAANRNAANRPSAHDDQRPVEREAHEGYRPFRGHEGWRSMLAAVEQQVASAVESLTVAAHASQ